MSAPATPNNPIGSAMLHVPVDGRNLFGRDNNAASLWLNFEPDLTEAPFSLMSWYKFFVQAMPLADALVDLLRHGLRLKCWDQPAARIAFMLQTPGARLTKLVDAGVSRPWLEPTPPASSSVTPSLILAGNLQTILLAL